MKIVLRKEQRGYQYYRLFGVELNDYDVERLLPSLFYLVVTKGRQRGGRVNDPKDFEKYLQSLSQHSRVLGFDTPSGLRLLDSWIRSSIIRVGAVGEDRRGKKIEYVLPRTILSYKTGFPSEISRQRNVHQFVYWIAHETLTRLQAKPTPQAALDKVFRDAFGKGVLIGNMPEYQGQYDGETDVDIHSLLSLCYLDGFKPTPASKKDTDKRFSPALPRQAQDLGRDLLLYILAYKDAMPSDALTRGLMALINFELLVYTLRLAYAVNAMVGDGRLPLAMQDTDETLGPELYVDFTRERGGASDDVARACVERDIEEIRGFLESSLLLRMLDRFLEFIPPLRDRLAGLDTPQYLHALVSLRADPAIEARAQAELAAISHDSMEACENDLEREELRNFMADLQRRFPESSLAVAVKILEAAQRKAALGGYVKWFYSVGGLRNTFGMLAGNLRGKRNWRYAMSDDLLATLVRLAMVQDPSGSLETVGIAPRLRLSDFLAFLRQRFGIVVERPPAFMESVGSRGAGKANLEAFKRRLRQMGFFEALSDDFTAQYLQMPTTQEVAT